MGVGALDSPHQEESKSPRPTPHAPRVSRTLCRHAARRPSWEQRPRGGRGAPARDVGAPCACTCWTRFGTRGRVGWSVFGRFRVGLGSVWGRFWVGFGVSWGMRSGRHRSECSRHSLRLFDTFCTGQGWGGNLGQCWVRFGPVGACGVAGRRCGCSRLCKLMQTVSRIVLPCAVRTCCVCLVQRQRLLLLLVLLLLLLRGC
jgi:hypothetical protein